MKKILFFGVVIIALYLIKPDLFSELFTSGAFDKDGKPTVWLFTAENCGSYCNDVVNFLDNRNIEYTEFNVNSDDGEDKLSEVGGSRKLPFTVIGSTKVTGNYTARIISALAEKIGEHTLTSMEQRVMNNHFYEGGEPMVVMYGTSWCGGCKKMRNYFNSNNIDYTEFDAEGSGQQAYKVLTARGYPLMYVGYRRIEGADIKRLEKAMKDFNI